MDRVLAVPLLLVIELSHDVDQRPELLPELLLRCLPVEAITRISDDTVYVNQTRQHIAGVPHYDPDLDPLGGR